MFAYACVSSLLSTFLLYLVHEILVQLILMFSVLSVEFQNSNFTTSNANMLDRDNYS